ncbi:FecR family protein [Sinomicrobium sp. M5D2P9]
MRRGKLKLPVYIHNKEYLMTEKQFKTLLNRFLEGKATEQEINDIEKFEDFFLDKNKGKVAHIRDKHIIGNEIYTGIKKRISPVRFSWTRIAASVVFLIGMGYGIFYLAGTPESIVVYNESSQPKEITLQDGSVITLNRNSRIVYTDEFGKADRNVELTGEAFFKVAKDPLKPFLIKTGELNTRVVGTRFNIKQNSASVSVTVSEGKVKVYHAKDTVNLTAGRQGVYRLKSGELEEKQVNASLYTLWQKDKIELNGVTIEDLCIVLHALYDIETVFENQESKKVLISITLNKNEQPEDIMSRVNLINEVKLTKTQNNMIMVEKNK